MTNRLNLRALLIDLNGTLHIGREPTPNAVRAIQRLREARIPFLFCSNSTRESDSRLIDKLRKMGFHIEPHELLTSIGACRMLVEDKKLKPYLIMAPEAKEEFKNIDSSPPHDSVILGLHEPSFSYTNINTAFRILKNEPLYQNQHSTHSTTLKVDGDKEKEKDPILIAPHTALFQQAEANQSFPAGLSLGIGPFVRALELASGVSAHIVGKPTRAFYEMAIAKIRANLKSFNDESLVDNQWSDDGVCIVGDDIVNDLGEGALAIGLKRVLVRTGKYRPGVEDVSDDRPAPDAVYDTFSDFVNELTP